MSQWGQNNTSGVATISMLGKVSPELVYGRTYSPTVDEYIGTINIYAANQTASDRYCKIAIFDITAGKTTATQIWSTSIKIPLNTATPTWFQSTVGYYANGLPTALQAGRVYAYTFIGDTSAEWTLYAQTSSNIGETLSTVTDNTLPSTWGATVTPSSIDPCIYFTSTTAGSSISVVNPGKINVKNYVQIGSAGNSAYSVNLLAATSGTWGAAMLSNVTGSNNAYQFTAPALIDGASLPYPSATLTLTDGTRVAQLANVSALLPTGMVSTKITSASPKTTSNYLKYNIPGGLATNDYIFYTLNPSAGKNTAVSNDGSIVSNVNGSQLFWKYNGVTGIVNSFSVTGINFGTGGYAASSTEIVSLPVTITGLTASTPLPIIPTGGIQYCISTDGGITYGIWLSSGGTVMVGNAMRVKLTSSASAGASTTGTITIDGVTSTFTVTTLPSTATIPTTAAICPVDNVCLSGYVANSLKTITGTGFGTRPDGKVQYFSRGQSMSGNPLVSRLTGTVYFNTAKGAATSVLGGGSVVIDLAQGGQAPCLIDTPIHYDGAKISVSSIDRYYDFDPFDSSLLDTPFNNQNVNTYTFNLKSQRFWSIGFLIGGKTHDVYQGGCGWQANTSVTGSTMSLPPAGTPSGYFNVENVYENRNGNYYTNSSPVRTWFCDEVIIKPSSVVGVRDGEYRHYRNNTWLTSGNLPITTSDINNPDPVCLMFTDEISNNTRADISFNTYYRHVLLDDDIHGVYYGNAATLGACTKLVRQPSATWSDTKVVYLENNDYGLTHWYVRTGLDSWQSTTGVLV